MVQTQQIDSLFCSVLAGRAEEWPNDWSDSEFASFRQRLHFHGVAALLERRSANFAHWPEWARAAISSEAQKLRIIGSSREKLVGQLLQDFAAKGVEFLLLKGARLAFSVYQDPAERARGDTDILVTPHQRSQAEGCLRACGFSPMPEGENGLHQHIWQSAEDFGFRHRIDLHWAITNSPALAQIFSADMHSRGMPLPGAGVGVMGAGNVDTLLHITLNIAQHRQHGYLTEGEVADAHGHIGWLFDVHLMASALTADEWRDLVDQASSAGVTSIVLPPLLEAQSRLGTLIPEWVLCSLENGSCHRGRHADIGTYLSTADAISRLSMDLRASQDFATWIAVLKAHALPPSSHLRKRFPEKQGWPLWILHMLRWAQIGRKA